ncbi:MAG: methylenetetrahydrofolate reductase [Neoaquamicrobium sediminum]|uniref:methylenetetrahydrofolate reductase n=1 Tax=Neoaquamicrobium sediminum TaxID=1849104 RepID=UPI0040374FC9
MAWLERFGAGRGGSETSNVPLAKMLANHSIEVMPRTAAKIDDFRALLPAGTRIYIAHIEGTPIDDMVATARRLRDDGFAVMPHVPARAIRDAAELEEWLGRYRDEAGVEEALLLAGGMMRPAGNLHSSIDMLKTGLFDRLGFRRLHVAGHPEGNVDIDPDGSSAEADKALLWKQAYSERTDAEMAIVTQFAFDAKPVIAWAERLRGAGVTMPIHVGVAGPAKLQTLIKYAVACGVGPSLKVLQRRALDVSRLMLPYEPDEVVTALAAYGVASPDSLIERIHIFPLGGIKAAAGWARERRDAIQPALAG